MVLGFALCTTMVFAQTQNVKSQRVSPRNDNETHQLKDLTKQQPVDYKASIFSKAGDYDTNHVFRFNATEWGTQITTGAIAAGDHIYANGHDSTFSAANANGVNVQAHPWCVWKRFADSASFINTVGTVYSDFAFNPNRVIANIGIRNNEGDAGWQDDGFAVLNYDEPHSGLGRVNIYMEFANITRPAAYQTHMIWIGLTQFYAKYYDQCFIDYYHNGKWNTREINVTGVDCEVNTYAGVKVRYALPLSMKDETNIKIRLRAFAPAADRNTYHFGYGWVVDNVAIISATGFESWEFSYTTPIEGFYGTVPAGMSIPVTYGAHVRNTNVTNINNAHLTLKAGPMGNLSNILTSDNFNIVSGDVDQDQKMYIDERGFAYGGDTMFNSGYTSWLGMHPNYGNTTGTLYGGYQGRSLPTTTPGAHQYVIYADGGNQHTLVDSVLYTVSNELVYPDGSGVNGYRWARDNGLLPSGSCFKVAFTNPNSAGQIYVSSDDQDDHSTKEGYTVHMSYVTGNEIPQGWVLKGIEYVPATDGNNFAGEGLIVPVVRYESYSEDGGTVSWPSVATGIEGLAFDLTEASLSNLPDTGYVLPTAGNTAPYSTLSIFFPNQPELRPNTGYRFGYQLNQNGNFHVASQATSYRLNDSTTANYSYSEETAPYRRQNTPIPTYQIYVSDAVAESDITGWNIDYFPMIRPIIGPREAVPTVTFITDCSTNTADSAVSVVINDEEQCGSEGVELAVGGNYSFTVRAAEDHTVIDQIFVNGQPVQIYDPNDPDHAEVPEGPCYLSYYATDRNNDNVDTVLVSTLPNGTIVRDTVTLLYRGYYLLRFYDLEQTDEIYTITATFHTEEWQDLPQQGIDPVAPEAVMVLYPNPATSTVKLNLGGVSGMVDCSIIDMSGRVVYNSRINSEVEHTINVSSMPAGAYFVRVTNDTFSKIEKLIIK